MSHVEMRIFFDESGKRNNKPNLMGGLSVPSELYESEKFQKWCNLLRDREVSFHWVGFTGDSIVRANILNLMSLVAKHRRLLKFNIINYDYSILVNGTSSKSIVSQTVYSKFPERLVYGLLRRYGKNITIDARICIEEATEYKDIALHQIMKDQLNVQSLYRGEQFRVTESGLVPKGREIGLEITDLLLGIVRTIILNEPDSKSKTVQAKNALVLELILDEDFSQFLEGFRLFEWTRTRELGETNFADYIQIYLAGRHKRINF